MRLDARGDLAGVEADPQTQPAPTAALLLDHPAYGGLHPGRRAHGPLGVVLVRDRSAEHRHQAVAGELVDVATELGHDVGQGGEDPVDHHADPLGVEVF